MNQRPSPSEHAEYYGKYIALVPDGEYIATLEKITADTQNLLQSVSEEKSQHRYASGKWSIRESWLHVADTERIMTYRALRIARGDRKPLSGFDQNPYVALSGADNRNWRSILDEYQAVRKSSIALFRGLPDDAWLRSGTASNNPVTVRALAFIVAGHDLHHRKLLTEKYLG